MRLARRRRRCNTAANIEEGARVLGEHQWQLRSVPDDLVRRYRAEGWWDDATLGSTVADGLSSMGDVEFNVHSKVRPWRGTFAEVDRAARVLAGSLRARGVGP